MGRDGVPVEVFGRGRLERDPYGERCRAEEWTLCGGLGGNEFLGLRFPSRPRSKLELPELKESLILGVVSLLCMQQGPRWAATSFG